MKIQILLIKDDASKARKIKTYLERKSNFKVVAIAHSLKHALEIYTSNEESINVVLIDMFLGKNSDVLFAKSIMEHKNETLPLIFIAHLNGYATKKSNRFKASNYFLNPLSEIELGNAIELAMDKFTDKRFEFPPKTYPSVYLKKPFFIKKNSMLVKVFEKDIQFVTVEGRYSKIQTSDGDFLVQLSLKRFLKISSSNFIQTHRNYIVNFDKIEKVFLLDNLILLKNGMRVDISRQYKQKFMNSYEVLV